MENNKKIKKKNILQKFSERRFFVVSRRYIFMTIKNGFIFNLYKYYMNLSKRYIFMTNKKWFYKSTFIIFFMEVNDILMAEPKGRGSKCPRLLR